MEPEKVLMGIFVFLLVIYILVEFLVYNSHHDVVPTPTPIHTPTPSPVPVQYPTTVPVYLHTPSPGPEDVDAIQTGSPVDPLKGTSTDDEKKKLTRRQRRRARRQRRRWLKEHNKRRAEFETASGRKIPPLIWDKKLAEQAKKWAQYLVDKGQWRHPKSEEEIKKYMTMEGVCTMGPEGDQCGQNLATAMGSANSGRASNPSPRKSLKGWVDKECPLYNGKLTGEAGHYSQAMWANAKKVGCAIVKSKPFESNGRMFAKGGVAACNYDTGNIQGNHEFEDNVPPPGVC